MSNELIAFTMTEPLGVDWREQLLCYRAEFDAPVKLALVRLRDDSGAEVPFQATDIAPAEGGAVQSATLWFWADLPAGSERRYTLVQVDKASREKAPHRVGKVREKVWLLASPLLRLQLVGSHRFRTPRAAEKTPGPLLGFSRPGHAWIGGSHWETPLRCTGITTAISESGPLWTEAHIRYDFEQGAGYAMSVRLYADRDYAVIDERMALRIDGQLVIHLSHGLQPDRFYVRDNGSSLSQDAHSLILPVPTTPGERLREIQLPSVGTYYVSHLTGYLGLFNRKHKQRGVLGLVGLDGAQWESAMHNRMRVAIDDDGEVVMAMPARAGRRRWALTITDPAPALVTGTGEQSSLLALRIRQSDVPLREVLAMPLTAPEGTGKLFFTDALLERARTRLLQLPEFSSDLTAVLAGEADDPAYAYLMTGERRYAEQARDKIIDGLRQKLAQLLLGGVTDGSFTTISLGRSIRAWLVTLDLLRREPGSCWPARKAARSHDYSCFLRT